VNEAVPPKRRVPWPWLALGLIVVTTVVTYRGVIGHQFVMDDLQTVRDNHSVRSLRYAGRWFTSPYAVSSGRGSQNYRPVTVASYALDYAVWGERPAGFHVTNVAIHLGVVGLTFVLARRLWGDDWAAAGAAGVVALHPINAEAVNYVTARSSSLMTLFVLAAVWARDHASAGRRWAWGIAALGCGVLALGTKEAAVVLPVLMMAWERMRGSGREPWGITLWRSLPWWVLVGGFLAVRAWVLAGGHATAVSGAGASIGQGVLLALKIYLTSMGMWLWPMGLAVDHAWPIAVGGWEAGLLVGSAVVAGFGTMTVARWERRIGWCLVWCLVALAPIGMLPFVTRLTLYQDHRVYLAGIALAWSVGWGGARLVRRYTPSPVARGAWLAAVGVLVVAVSWADAGRAVAWTDSAHLWDDVLAKYPNSPLAYNGKGLILLDASRLDEAQRSFEHARRLAPGLAVVHSNLGVVFTRLGEWDRAAASFEFALKINPFSPFAQLRLAEVYEHQGRVDKALVLYERILRNDPEWTTGLVRSAALLERRGRWEEAVARYRRAIEIDPDQDEARVALGAALLARERWAAAREAFLGVLARRPDSYAARFYIGMTYAREGRDDAALPHWLEAARLNPDDPELLIELGLLYGRRGEWVDAIGWYDRALQREPASFMAHVNLALAAERVGDAGRAISHYRAFLRTAPHDAGYEGLRTRAQEAIVRLTVVSRTTAEGEELWRG